MEPTVLPFAGAARPLAPTDIAAAARTLGVNEATIKAVMTVEAAGSGFLSDRSGRPRILFEAHHFSSLTKGKFDRSHSDISSPTWNRLLYRGGAAEYDRLARAIALDANAAKMSASWGLFQILASNFQNAGFASPDAFLAAMAESEGRQLGAFVSIVQAWNLTGALRIRDWDAFAAKYNGPGYAVNKYPEKLEAAYDDASGTAAATPAGQKPTLRMGSSGHWVDLLQGMLRQREASMTLDGSFGRQTQAAVMRFQTSKGLWPDGIVGPATWQALSPIVA